MSEEERMDFHGMELIRSLARQKNACPTDL